MKILNKLALMAGMVTLVASTVFAQGNFDYFAAPKTLTLEPATSLNMSGGTLLLTTNTANISRFLGIVALDIYSTSNNAALASTFSNTNSFNVYTSQTGTNGWTPITNFMATSTSVIYSNYFGTSNNAVVYFTNTFQVPGTLTNSTVPNSGFSGQYVIPATANATLNGTSAAASNWTYGFDADNAGSYIQIVWQTIGSNAEYSVGATLRGRTKSGVY